MDGLLKRPRMIYLYSHPTLEILVFILKAVTEEQMVRHFESTGCGPALPQSRANSQASLFDKLGFAEGLAGYTGTVCGCKTVLPYKIVW